MKVYSLASAATAASLFFATACAPNAPKPAAEKDPGYFKIDNVETVELPYEELSPELQSLLDSESVQDPTPGKSPLDETEETLDQMIRIGKKVYQIVNNGKPSYNATYYRTHILPKGTLEWQQLTGWQTPVAKRYEWRLKNLYGMEVVTLRYRVLFTPGGSLNEFGKYLQHVTILPEEVNVAWGFNLNVMVSLPSITNAGTLASPVAAAELLIDASVNNVLTSRQMTQSYYVRGDGLFKAL